MATKNDLEGTNDGKRRIRNKKKQNKKAYRSKVVWTYIIIAIMLICCYLGVYHTHHYRAIDVWIFMTGVGGIIILQSMWFEAKNPKWDKLRSFLAMVLIGGPVCFGVYKLHKRYWEKQLSENGIITHAKVVDVFKENGYRGGYTYYAKFEYQVNDRIWFQKVQNNDFRIAVNDSLKIRCSTEEPEIFEVVAIKKATDY